MNIEEIDFIIDNKNIWIRKYFSWEEREKKMIIEQWINNENKWGDLKIVVWSILVK